MQKPFRFLPGFKGSCLTVCILYILLTGSLFGQGLMKAMGSFQVPQATLDSPHYYNAIFWVYSEMLVMGLMIGAIGLLVKEAKAQIWLSRLICASQAYFTWLDMSASDSVLGNGLYKGPESLMPGFICLFFTLLFLHLSFGRETKAAVAG